MKTEAQLKLDVAEELKWEPSVNATQIGVEVKEGIVTLAGHVESYAEKWNAEAAAQRVSGVKALAVEMDVKLPGDSRRTDADIARTAQQALSWTSCLPKDSIKIQVEKGFVTLRGEVEWEYQRSVAATAVRHLLGVSGVSDQIAIKHSAAAPLVKDGIEAALRRRASSDAQDISVTVDGADVTLTGLVHSWSERELARGAAWSARGVHKVIDQMTLAS